MGRVLDWRNQVVGCTAAPNSLLACQPAVLWRRRLARMVRRPRRTARRHSPPLARPLISLCGLLKGGGAWHLLWGLTGWLLGRGSAAAAVAALTALPAWPGGVLALKAAACGGGGRKAGLACG